MVYGGEKKAGSVNARIEEVLEKKMDDLVSLTGLGRSDIVRLALFDFLTGSQKKRKVLSRLILHRKKNPNAFSLPWELRFALAEGF